jgi:adenine phosphoribosyltransferase
MDLERFIRDVPGFPREGVLFKDITPLLGNPAAFQHTLDRLEANVRDSNAQAIVGIESRGFIFGTPLAARMGLPFVPVRKPGKLPAAHMSVEYSLEYGSGQLDIHADALERGVRAYIVDDLLATGGTALATCQLIEKLGGVVSGLAFVVELDFLKGRQRLANYDIFSVLQYDK